MEGRVGFVQVVVFGSIYQGPIFSRMFEQPHADEDRGVEGKLLFTCIKSGIAANLHS